MKCKNCGTIGDDKNWKYCSIQCRNETVSTFPRNTHRQTFKICAKCGKSYKVKNSQALRSRYCSNVCKYERNK